MNLITIIIIDINNEDKEYQRVLQDLCLNLQYDNESERGKSHEE